MNPRERKPNPAVLWNHTDAKVTKTYGRDNVKQEQYINSSADNALHNAKSAAFVSLPLITKMGIEMLGDTHGYMPLAALGIPVTVGGIVIDTIKAPISLVVAGEEAIRGGMLKIVSALFEKSGLEQANEQIFKSFLLRMRETATLLVALNLETENVLNEKLKSGDIEELVGLTLLHTAYASRNYNSDSLLLASGKQLHRMDCPEEGLDLFNAVIDLRNTISNALKLDNEYSYSQVDKEKEQSRIVCDWIRLIKAGKTLATGENGVTQSQADVVNRLIHKISNLKALGMEILPESPAQVGNHVPRFKK